MSISKLRGWLYQTAKLLGDVQAIRKGPKAVGKRVVRRAVGKGVGKLLGKLFR